MLPIHTSYKLHREDFEAVCQVLTAYHRLIVGWVTDVHYLLHHDVPPVLLSLLPEVLQDIPAPYAAEIIQRVVAGYRQVYDALEAERPAWAAELTLQLAESLAQLPDKSYASEQAIYAFQSWKKLHKISRLEVSQATLEALPLLLKAADITQQTAAEEAPVQELRDVLPALREAQQLLEDTQRALEHRDLAALRPLVQTCRDCGQEAVTERIQGMIQTHYDTLCQKEPQRAPAYRAEQWKVLAELGWLPPSLVNSIGMQFVLIPAGEFQMGSETGYNDEKPVHTVRLTRPFYLGQYPVTQGQWQAVMGNNPSHFTSDPNRPVEYVSWDDVHQFIAKLNAREGVKLYRLPTEAEWEYAARARATTAYRFGSDEQQLAAYAWYDRNSGSTTHPVGQKQPNAWGLCDMHGNVWEWVQDWYGSYAAGAGSTSPATVGRRTATTPSPGTATTTWASAC